MFEEKFFEHKKLNPEKLLKYGFTKTSGSYQYMTAIMNGQLRLSVFIAFDGSVSTKVIDNLTNEEYLLYKVASSVGAYVGEVRSECENVLTDISLNCYDPDIFHSEQTLDVIKYVREKFDDEPEFLWKRFPDNAIWRRKDNRKWYGLIITISKRKLGLDSDEIVEAVDLRSKLSLMAITVDNESFFPGWHMNKKSWYTIVLDGSIPTEEICRRIDESYNLAIK